MPTILENILHLRFFTGTYGPLVRILFFSSRFPKAPKSDLRFPSVDPTL